MAIEKFNEIRTQNYRALQIYQILIGLAHNRQTITYGGLASIVGYKGAGVFSQQLSCIMSWCDENAIPPLTVLVVRGKNGKPGVGLTTIVELNRDRERVYDFNWYGIVPPRPEDFFWE